MHPWYNPASARGRAENLKMGGKKGHSEGAGALAYGVYVRLVVGKGACYTVRKQLFARYRLFRFVQHFRSMHWI